MRERKAHSTQHFSSDEIDGIAVAFREGDEIAFRSVYEAYRGQIYRFCRHLLGEEALAKDAFQETFIKSFEHRAELRGSNIRSWLFVIARRVCLNMIRSRRQHHEPFNEGAHCWQTDSPQDFGLRDQIEAALSQLPPSMREAIVLREFDGYSYSEIAKMCGIEVSLAKVRVHRARISLRKILASLMLLER